LKLVLTALQDTYFKLHPIDSSQLGDKEKLRIDSWLKFAPISWAIADNQHIQFGVNANLALYAFVPHVSLTQDGVDVLAPKVLVTQDQATYIFQTQTNNLIFCDLNACLIKFGITDKEDIRQFLAQCAHESGGLQYLKELASGDDYEGREDLGNIQAGDGRKYKGGGLIQLTGRENYTKFADFMGDPEIVNQGVDYVANRYPVSSAGYFWYSNGISDRVKNGATIEDTTRIVNGGLNGLSDRVYFYNRAKEVI